MEGIGLRPGRRRLPGGVRQLGRRCGVLQNAE
jgi:hypothetical protein